MNGYHFIDLTSLNIPENNREMYLDKHWIVFGDHGTHDEIIMRFPSKEQAEVFVEKRINYIWDTENNSEKEA